MEFEPPKYARVVAGVQKWITDGTYRSGDMLPSETQLVKQFAVGRTTVVRALQLLQKDGWIHREHGRGSFVKGVPVVGGQDKRPALMMLDRPEAVEGTRLLEVGRTGASSHIARHLGVEPGSELVFRRWLVERGGEPSELASLWIPVDLAQGTNLEGSAPLLVGIRQDLAAFKLVTLAMVRERTAARLPTEEEARLLKIAPAAPVLVLTNSYLADGSERPLLVIELVMPGELHELEAVYALP